MIIKYNIGSIMQNAVYPVGQKPRIKILKSIDLKCAGFEFCFEVTIQIAKKGIRIKEVPINYYPRKMADGKKIKGLDGICAAWVLRKYRFVD